MQFCWVTIHVHDMEKSLAFYRDIVGLALKRQFSPTHCDVAARWRPLQWFHGKIRLYSD